MSYVADSMAIERFSDYNLRCQSGFFRARHELTLDDFQLRICSNLHSPKMDTGTMKSISFRLDTAEDFDACLQIFRAQCPQNPASILVSIFSGWPVREDIVAFANRVRQAVPQAVIVGCTTSGEITAGAMSLRKTCINFAIFEKTALVVRIVDFAATPALEGAKSLVHAYQGNKDLAGIELLFAQNDANIYPFLSVLNQFSHAVSMFGGVAGTIDNVSESFVFNNNEIIKDGVVAICFLGEDTHIQVNTSLGWNALGPWFSITGVTAENIISELDYKPACFIYEKYLAIPFEEFEQENLVFPLVLERNGQPILRHPARATRDGTIVMHGDCQLGERVRLAYGDPAKILDDVQGIANKEVAQFNPEGILIFNCSSRRFFLRGAADHELRPFQNIAQSAGLYTAGEVGRANDGDVTLLNMTLVSACFREGEGRSGVSKPPCLPSAKPLTGTMKLVKHLAHFIAATSAELEEANQHLTEMATMDRLTGLYNRGEIESILKKEIDSRRQENRPLSAIILDLDDFKKINDTYGHAVGDQVLRWVGGVLRRQIRRGDTAGRWGGEEFFVILPESSVDAAENIAERIRVEIGGDFTLPDGKHISVSLGAAEYSDAISYMDFYRALDEALYAAKQNGKNQVRVAGRSR